MRNVACRNVRKRQRRYRFSIHLSLVASTLIFACTHVGAAATGCLPSLPLFAVHAVTTQHNLFARVVGTMPNLVVLVGGNAWASADGVAACRRYRNFSCHIAELWKTSPPLHDASQFCSVCTSFEALWPGTGPMLSSFHHTRLRHHAVFNSVGYRSCRLRLVAAATPESAVSQLACTPLSTAAVSGRFYSHLLRERFIFHVHSTLIFSGSSSISQAFTAARIIVFAIKRCSNIHAW